MPLPLIPIFAGLSMAMAVGSTGLGMFGDIMGGNAQKNEAEANAKIAEHKARMAEKQAEFAEYNAAIARAQGEAQADVIVRERDDVIASQKVTASKSGVISTAPLHVMADTAVKAEQDIRMAKWAGEVEFLRGRYGAHLQEVQAGMHRQDAAMLRAGGKSAQSASYLSAGGSLLTGASGLMQDGLSFFGKTKKDKSKGGSGVFGQGTTR